MIHRNNLNSVLVLVLILLAIAGLGWANYRYIMPMPGPNDFTMGWVAANMYLMKGISPYDVRVTQEIVHHLSGLSSIPSSNLAKYSFSYPLFTLIIFAPFSVIGYDLARAFWMLLIELSYISVILVCFSLSGWKLKPIALGLVLIWSITIYIGVHSIYLGQFTIFILAIMFVSVWIIHQGNEEWSGFLLAFSLVKPEVSLIPVGFILLWSIFTRRYRLTISLLAGIAFLLSVTLILMPGWPLQWIRAIIDSAGKPDWFGSGLSRVAFALPGIKRPLFIFLNGALLVILLIQWITSFRRDVHYFYWTWLLTLVVTSLVSPRADTSILIVLIPIVFQLFQIWQTRWGKGSLALIWLSLISFFAGFWLIVLPSIRQELPEPLILYILPPAIGLLLLVWIRFWVIRPARLPFEVYRDL